MLATLQERGSRPFLLTAARKNAPQGAKVIIDLLSTEDFADMAALVIDWEGDIMWDYDKQGAMPAELKKPTLFIMASKWYREIDRRVELEVAIDLEDAFSQDTFSNDTAVELVQYMREEFDKKRQEFEQGIGPWR